MDASAAREGDRKIPSARLPGEYGAPAVSRALVSRRASADSFRKLAAKLRSGLPAPEVPPAPDMVPAGAVSPAPQAPDPAPVLQTEIELPAEPLHTSHFEPVVRERFDMGWTSHAISPGSPTHRRVSEQFGLLLDEFSDLPPEFSDDRGQVEVPAPVQSNSVHQTTRSGPVAATAPTLARPDNYRFWEQTSVEVAAAEAPAGEDPPPQSKPGTKVEPAAAPFPVAHPSKPSKIPGASGPAKPSEGSAQAAEKAWSLLEIISLSNDTTQPQERALAADALLNLLPKLTARILMTISDRMSLMEAPPRLIVNQLVRDHRPEIAGPLLEKSVKVSDQDLVEVIAGGQIQSIRMIARRRTLTSALCNAVIATGEPSVILTLVRNPGAAISHEGFIRLNAIARQHTSLQAPLATHSDLPAPVAFELFWSLPVELRRYVLSRFLTDSKTLERILKITKSVESEMPSEDPLPGNFPARERVDQFVALVVSGDSTNAARLLAELAGIQESNAARIIADGDGEPIAAALKALGVPRVRFEEIIHQCRLSPACALRQDRKVEELQGLFDTLSFNKARVLLTYWDWAASQSGPYDLASA